MTTPDTTAVRAWARENGYDVAGRGRLPAEVVEAYQAAQRGGAAKEVGRAAAKGALAKRPAKKAPAKTSAKAPAKAPAETPVETVDQAPAKKAGRAAAKGAPTAKAAPAKAAPAKGTTTPEEPAAPAPRAAERPDPTPKPSPVTDDRRLVALGEQLRALTERVDALEKALGSDKGGKGSKPRFRRR